MAKLYFVFRCIPSKHKKHEYVEVTDVMSYFNIGENKFMNRGFRSLCFEGRTCINFLEFVMLVWYYCTIGTNLHYLAFYVYDVDGNEVLEASEADQMLTQIYGKYYATDPNSQLLTRKVKELGKEGLSKLIFVEFCKRNKDILSPAYKYIGFLMKYTLGSSKWMRMVEHRKLLTRDKFFSVLDLIVRVQDKAGDDSDLFNIGPAIARRDAREKKRLRRHYSKQYLKSIGSSDDITDDDLEKSPAQDSSTKKKKVRSPRSSSVSPSP